MSSGDVEPSRGRQVGAPAALDRAKRLRKNGGFNRDLPHIARAQPLAPCVAHSPPATHTSRTSTMAGLRRHGGPRCHAPRSRRRREEKGRRLRRRGSRRASPRARASLRDAPSGNDASFPFTHRTPLVASRSLEANTPGAPSWPASRPISPSRPTRRFKRLRDARLRGSDRPPLTRAVRQGRGPEGRHAALGQLGGNPSLVRALQGKLDGLAGKSSGFIEELHYKVKARVDQLDEIRISTTSCARSSWRSAARSRRGTASCTRPLYAKRAAIVKGEVDVEAAPSNRGRGGRPARRRGGARGRAPIFGRGCATDEALEQIIEERDEPALSHLLDITSRPLTKADAEERGGGRGGGRGRCRAVEGV